MDYLQDLGYLALGSRLKRLSERFGQEVSTVYDSQHLDFEPRWFPVFRYVAEKSRVSITQIAEAVGLTHPAINQMAQELVSAGLFKAASDPQDKRRRLLFLTDKGKKLYENLQPVWRHVHAAVSDLVEDAGVDLVSAISAMENAMNRNSLASRFDQLSQMSQISTTNIKPKIEIKDLTSELEPHFARLNRSWIEKYFSLEKSDLEQFARPDKIVKDGGAVLFICVDDRPVGTCALKKKDSKTFELIKMAVDEAYRGMGLGRQLLEESIKRAIKMGARKMILETNRKLKAAVELYKSLGFKIVSPDKAAKSPYARVDLVMELDLTRSGPTKRK